MPGTEPGKGMHQRTYERLKAEREHYAGFAWAGLWAEVGWGEWGG